MEDLRSCIKDGIPFREAPGIDRLSNLPKDALDQILVRLPIRLVKHSRCHIRQEMQTFLERGSKINGNH